MTNNIVYNSANGILEAGITGVHNTYQDNLLFGVTGTKIRLQNGLTASGTVSADPKFVNAPAHDYRLQSGSPAIDTGAAAGAPPLDFAGNPRPSGKGYDIGAYEATSAPTPTSLVLKMNEDYYQGDAQFTVAIDGQQQGGVQTVTARHSAGNSQTFSFLGNFSVGNHDIAVSFLNDMYGGTPTTDRNLYVQSISLGSQQASGTPYEFYSNGTHHFDITQSS